MRILIISHAYVSKYHQQKIEALAKYKDLEIFLMVPEFGIEGGGQKIYLEKKQDPNYTIIPVQSYYSGKWNSYIIKKFRKYIKEIKPDIVYIEEEYWTNVAWQMARVKRMPPKAKIVLFTWENIFHDWLREGKSIYQKIRFALFYMIEKKVLSYVDAIIAGNKEASLVAQKKGFTKSIEIVPQFGVDMNYFKKKNSDWLKMELALERRFVVGYIGRIAKEKGIEDLIKVAVVFSKQTIPYVKFLVIGNGPYKQEAQELVRTLGLEERFVFVPSVDFNFIVDYYSLMDVMVIPSRTTPEWKEQFGRTIIEAMSCGIPVIGSDSGAIPEVVGDAGLIFREGDVNDLTEKIAQVMNNNQLKEDLIMKGQKRVQENFTMEIIARRVYETFKKLELRTK